MGPAQPDGNFTAVLGGSKQTKPKIRAKPSTPSRMANTKPSDQALKRLRELLPENGKDVPDEFITEILESCHHDLTKTFEELQDRLSRASWESVDNGKKKRQAKQSKGNSSFSAGGSDRRRGHSSISDHGSYQKKDGPRSFGDSIRPKAASLASPTPGVKHGGVKESSPPSNRNIVSKTPSPVVRDQPIPLSKSLERSDPVACSNQWAKGRPQVLQAPKPNNVAQHPARELEKESLTAVPEVEVQQSSAVEEEIESSSTEPPMSHSESASLDSSHTEDTLPHDGPLVSSEKSEDPNATCGEGQTAEPSSCVDSKELVEERSRPIGDQPCLEADNGNCTEALNGGSQQSGNSVFSDLVNGTASDFERFKMSGNSNEMVNPVHPTQTAPGMENHANISLAQPDHYPNSGPYGHYSAYPQQYHAAQPQFSVGQDNAGVYNGGKVYYPGTTEGGLPSLSAMDPSMQFRGGANFANKTSCGPKGQATQNGGWQSPMLNYGMLTTNMYAMSPQQMQMLCMQQYGMNLPYNSGAMNGQVYNTASFPSQQGFGMTSKMTSNNQNPQNKKHQQHPYTAYSSGFAPPNAYNGASFGSSGIRAEDYYKHSRLGAENFDSNYSQSFAGLGLGSNYDASASSQPGYNAVRCSNIAGGMGVPVQQDDGGYFNLQSRSPYFEQANASHGQWIGGN